MKEPQINEDERRYNPVTDFSRAIHRKGRKERKAHRGEFYRPLRSGMKKVIFLIEKDPKGGFNARALDYSIFTQGETLEEVRENIIDAVNCHFDNSNDIMVEVILHERR
ncbi:Uncharacterised protein [uncultured archaeon]|nr:Uncharacterised protein [uncultured archaeon]